MYMFYPFGLFFDPTIIFLIPALILTIYAQQRVKTTFNRYIQVATQKGYTGYEVAQMMTQEYGLHDLRIEQGKGYLSDHYDPRQRVIRLSQAVYNGTSIAAVSVAAHEVGHAIQHKNRYIPLRIRQFVFPIARFGSSLSWFLIILGLLIPTMAPFIDIGIYLFSFTVLFQIITIPVEWNASKRAMNYLVNHGILINKEKTSAQKVLQAAAWTYIAAMATAISQLARFIFIRNQRRR